MKKNCIGIMGGTGAIGQELIQLFLKKGYSKDELRVFASDRSAGKRVKEGDVEFELEMVSEGIWSELSYAFFCVDGDFSRKWGKKAAQSGCVVIDKSSAYRLDEEVPLVIPEVNGDVLCGHKGIVASPNCSTIITLMGLYPLHRCFGLKRFFATTYQAVSGSGVEGVRELEGQMESLVRGEAIVSCVYEEQIVNNVLPRIGGVLGSGYTDEEEKMRDEGRKIMDLRELGVSTTCVRVPTMRSHMIVVNAEFERGFEMAEAIEALRSFRGVILMIDGEGEMPTALGASGKEECLVGRLRRDSIFGDKGLSFVVVGDQLLKGGALNAMQIYESLESK